MTSYPTPPRRTSKPPSLISALLVFPPRVAFCPILILLAISCPPASHAQVACAPPALAVGDPMDPSNIVVPAFGGRSYGEVFFAPETLIRAVTVWRPAMFDTVIFAHQLFIAEAGSSGSIVFPYPWRVIYSSQPTVRWVGDGVHPVPYRFVIDPPLALPHAGLWFFAVKNPGCDLSVMRLLANTRNLYPEGAMWETWPTLDCSGLGTSSSPDPATWSLVFRVEFCSGTTRASQRSWGQLKLLYR